MAKKIIASKLFLKRVVELNTYLENEWGLKVATDFHAALIKIIQHISDNPGMGSDSTQYKNVRKILVTKHNKLYYRVNSRGSITLLILFDTRQHPKQNKYK